MTESTPQTPSTKSSATRIVFDHWVATCRNSGRGRTPVLGDKRRRIIDKAIKLYGVDTCLDAISGVTKSDWHMGKNPRGKKYDSIELILRDEEHIEKFADLNYDEETSSAFQDFLND